MDSAPIVYAKHATIKVVESGARGVVDGSTIYGAFFPR